MNYPDNFRGTNMDESDDLPQCSDAFKLAVGRIMREEGETREGAYRKAMMDRLIASPYLNVAIK